MHQIFMILGQMKNKQENGLPLHVPEEYIQLYQQN